MSNKNDCKLLNEKKPNRIKLYGIILGVILAFLQHGFYLLGHGIAVLFKVPVYFNPKIPIIDDAFKVVSIFVIPYVWAYLFWAMAPMAVSKCEKNYFLNYIATYLLSCLIGMIMLAVIPTQMDRVAEGLYNDNPQGFSEKLLQFWYSLDGTKMAYNLFPSFHCLNSTVSYLGVMKRKEIPLWYRIYSFAMMIIIFLATLFVKQHYFLDIIGGAGVAIICYIVCMKFNLGKIFNKPIEFFKKKFSKKK